MFKKKEEPSEAAPKGDAPGWYKGYDVRWLRQETEHPDYNLVAEYDAAQGGN